jgi:hypothetical protein
MKTLAIATWDGIWLLTLRRDRNPGLAGNVAHRRGNPALQKTNLTTDERIYKFKMALLNFF